MQLPEKDEVSQTREQLHAQMAIAMGGRVAEEIVYGEEEVTTGASNDLQQVANVARQMITKFGMSDKIGPVAAFKVVIVIKRLPKTRSGKILRGTIRKIADGVEYKIPPTIDDPAILTEIKEDLINHKILNNG